MKTTKKNLLRSSVLAVAVASAVSFVAPASADVTAAASVSNMYLWRGIDLGLGDGTPAVSGEIRYTQSGFYTGVWGSSGDATLGSEYDLFAGYGGELSGFKYDLSIWNYMYPSSPENACETTVEGDELVEACSAANNEFDDFGGLSEVILTLGYGPVSFSYYDNIADAGAGNGYQYLTLSASYSAFSATLGTHDYDTEESGQTDMTHLDLSYAFNENIKFTLSQVIDTEEEDTYDEDLKFVVGYTLPIDLK